MPDAPRDQSGLPVVVEQESLRLLPRHAQTEIAFTVDRVLVAEPLGDHGLHGIALREQSPDRPWRKDYDADNPPTDWPRRFDVTHWGLLGAYENHERVGGAVIAHRTPGLHMLADRDDLAVLWDLRVAPRARGRGVGTALLHAAEDWARARGCRELTIETQNVNVAACRFYAHVGCTLSAINRHAYPDLPDEVQLIWSRSLTARAPS